MAPLFKESNTKQGSVPTNVGTSFSVLLEPLMENNESKITCPYRFEYIDTVPDGVRPHHHDRFSMLESFGKDTTLFIQKNKETMTSCILYHAPTRTRWRLYFTAEKKAGGLNPDFMTALIEMHDKGMF